MLSSRFSGPVWSAFRVVIGLLFASHGFATVLGLFGGAQGSGHAAEVGAWPGWYAGVIQLVCGLLVLIGLGTRPAAVLASGSMAYAYFVVHQPEGLLPIENGGVSSALYAWAFLAIAALGAGPWSIDALISARRTTAEATPTPTEPSPALEPATTETAAA